MQNEKIHLDIYETPINLANIERIKAEISKLSLDELSYFLFMIEKDYFGVYREQEHLKK